MSNRILAILACAMLAACAGQQQRMANIPASPPSGEPAGLTGLAGPELRAAFGAPTFVRKDGATEIWRYDGQTCKAFFFLYPQGSAVPTVTHVETLPRGTAMAADTTCLGALRTPAKVS
jgi:hypothetical protein